MMFVLRFWNFRKFILSSREFFTKKNIFKLFSLPGFQTLLITTIVLLFVFSDQWKIPTGSTIDSKMLIIVAGVGFLVLCLYLLIFYRLYSVLMIEINLLFLAFSFFLFNHIGVKYDPILIIQLFGLVVLGTSTQLVFYKKIKKFFPYRAALWLYLKKNWRDFGQAASNYFLIYFAPLGILLFISFWYFISGQSASPFDKDLIFITTLINISLSSLIAGVIQVGFFYLIFYIFSYFFSVFIKKNFTDFHLIVKKNENFCIIAQHHNNIFLKAAKNWSRQTFMTLFVFVVFFIFLFTIPATWTFLKQIKFFSKSIEENPIKSLINESLQTNTGSQITLYYVAFIFGWIFVSFYFLVLFRFAGFLFFLQNIITKLLFLFVWVIVLSLFNIDFAQKIFPFLVIALIYDLIFINSILFLGRMASEPHYHSKSIKFFWFFSQKNLSVRTIFFVILIIVALVALFFSFGYSSTVVLLLMFIKFNILLFYYNLKQIMIYLKINQWNSRLKTGLNNAYTNLPAKYQE